MIIRMLVFLAVALVASYSAAIAETPSKAACPFLYELPEDIKSYLSLERRDQRGLSVSWRVECRLLHSHERGVSFINDLVCRIEPTSPHRRVCLDASDRNYRDGILLYSHFSFPGTKIVYLAEAPNDYKLEIIADVKPSNGDALIEVTLQKMLKISRSLHAKNKNFTFSGQNLSVPSTKADALPAMAVFKTGSGCPFEFELPIQYRPTKINKFPKSVSYSGRAGSIRWSIACSRNPKHHSHLRNKLTEINCIVETWPPHYRICKRSKRWNGTEWY